MVYFSSDSEITLPVGWKEKSVTPSSTRRVFFEIVEIDQLVPVVLKSVVVDLPSMKITKFMMGAVSGDPISFQTISDVVEILRNYDSDDMCGGI